LIPFRNTVSVEAFSNQEISRQNMGQVLPFRRENAFLPETTKMMGEAYDSAIATVQAGAKSELFIRELVAKRIIHAAYIGEVDRGTTSPVGAIKAA
jgi:hypothetical protein